MLAITREESYQELSVLSPHIKSPDKVNRRAANNLRGRGKEALQTWVKLHHSNIHNSNLVGRIPVDNFARLEM